METDERDGAGRETRSRGGGAEPRDADRRALFEALYRDSWELTERQQAAGRDLRFHRPPRDAGADLVDRLARGLDRIARPGGKADAEISADPDGETNGGTAPLVPDEPPTVSRCPDLPPLSGLFSRLRPGRDDTVNPYLVPFVTRRDNLEEVDEPQSGVTANGGGGNLYGKAVAAATKEIVTADVAYAFRLMPRWFASGHDRVVRAHLVGLWLHTWLRSRDVPGKLYTWRLSVGVELAAWLEAERRYETVDRDMSVLSDTQEEKNPGGSRSHRSWIPFERACEVSTSAVHQHLLVRVGMHIEVGAPPAPSSLAYSELECELGICAVDVGLVPSTLGPPRRAATAPIRPDLP